MRTRKLGSQEIEVFALCTEGRNFPVAGGCFRVSLVLGALADYSWENCEKRESLQCLKRYL